MKTLNPSTILFPDARCHAAVKRTLYRVVLAPVRAAGADVDIISEAIAPVCDCVIDAEVTGPPLTAVASGPNCSVNISYAGAQTSSRICT